MSYIDGIKLDEIQKYIEDNKRYNERDFNRLESEDMQDFEYHHLRGIVHQRTVMITQLELIMKRNF